MIDLRRYPQLFARIASISADAIVSVDDELRILFFNRGAEAIFGWAADEIVGQPLDVLLPERYRGVHTRHIVEFGRSDVEAKRMGERLPIAGLRRDGSEFPAEASITKLDADGTLIYTAVLRDISERQRVQETQQFLARVGTALVGSLDLEETLSTVAQLAVPALGDWASVWLEDEEGLRRLQTAYADPSLADAADRLRALVPLLPETHPGREAFRTGASILVEEAHEELLVRAAPEPAHREAMRGLGVASAMFVPLVGRTTVLGVVCHYRSRPGRPFAERDLALAEELARRAALAVDNARLYAAAREAVQAREDVMRIVSHDVGNPLSAILVGTKVVRGGLERGRGADQLVEYVDGIRQSADQIQRLIDALLDVERLHAGRLRLDPVTLPASELVANAISAFRSLAEEKEVELRASGLECEARVRVDPDRILQVFSNLLGNALKYTPAGGLVEIGLDADDARAAFTVRDTGRGIDPADLPHVFERFWQGRRALGRGAGLGLPIAQGLVEAHGGLIRAESEPGRGSTFTFVLPLADAP